MSYNAELFQGVNNDIEIPDYDYMHFTPRANCKTGVNVVYSRRALSFD